MATIRDYLPKKEPITNLQVKMSKKLVEKVKLQMKDDDVDSWNDFFTACFMSYLDNKKTGANNSINCHIKKL